MSVPKPKVIVFDLDYTLWPFWVDTHVTPPFKKGKQDEVVDTHGQHIKYYKDVPSILKQLKEDGFQLGVASRTSEISGAKQLLNLFNWNKYFSYKEIYPGCKVTHFSKIQESSGVQYKDMLFFDDEQRNIIDLEKIGVLSILVRNKFTHAVLKYGLQEYAKQRTN